MPSNVRSLTIVGNDRPRGGVDMLEWLGLIPLLGLQGNWRGYKMGGTAVGGVMDADMKGKFEAARAAGDMDKAKAMADKAQAEKPEKENGKGAGEKSVSKLIDKNESAFVGMSKKEIDELKGINEKTSVDDMERIINNFGVVDSKTFDSLQQASRKLTGENAVVSLSCLNGNPMPILFGFGIISSSVSKMSKTRLAAIIPICISLNLSAICRNGLNNIPINIVYAVI